MKQKRVTSPKPVLLASLLLLLTQISHAFTPKTFLNACRTRLSPPIASARRKFESQVVLSQATDSDPQSDNAEIRKKRSKNDEIDPDSLGDWRVFRRNLAAAEARKAAEIAQDDEPTLLASSSFTPSKSVSKLNEHILRTQSESLYDEYVHGVWAHTTATVR